MKRSMVFILFFVSAPVLLATRVIQQLYMIDPLTGFYQNGFAPVGNIISALCFVLIAVTLAMVWLSHPQVPTAPERSKPLGFAAMFAAFCLILSSTAAVMPSGGAKLATVDMLVGALGFAAAATLAYFGASLVWGFAYPVILTVVPVAYAILRLVTTFLHYTGEIAVTDTVFSLTTQCLILLFFYTSGKLVSGVSGKRTHILFYSYGLCAAFFCADSAFAHLIIKLTRSTAALHGNSSFDIAYIGFAVYIVVAVWILSGTVYRTREEIAE